MNPLTREAVEWIVSQPTFYIERLHGITKVSMDTYKTFTDRNTEDAICAAYEALHVKPALADERTTLPDYGNHA